MPYTPALVRTLPREAILDTIVDKISRDKGKASLPAIQKAQQDDFGLKSNMDSVKKSTLKSLKDRVQNGIFGKVANSYTVTPKGLQFFKDTYEERIDDGALDGEDELDTTMVDDWRGDDDEGDTTLVGEADDDGAGTGEENEGGEGGSEGEKGEEEEEGEAVRRGTKRKAPTQKKMAPPATGGNKTSRQRPGRSAKKRRS